MIKLKIKIYIYGPLPFSLNISKIKKWHSSIFIIDEVLTINNEKRIYPKDPTKQIDKSDIVRQTQKKIKDTFKFITHDKLSDLNLILGYVDLGEDWFLYSLKDNGMANTFILSYQYVFDELNRDNIPLENLIFSSLYTYSLYFLKYNALPTKVEEKRIMHFDTRGCLFDFTGSSSDVKFYTNYPIICPHCHKNIIDNDIDKKVNIRKINRELQKIRKNFFYRLYENVKGNTITYIILTSCFSEFITKVTTSSTYSNFYDIIIMVVLGSISIMLIIYICISFFIMRKKRYSQNINSHRTR